MYGWKGSFEHKTQQFWWRNNYLSWVIQFHNVYQQIQSYSHKWNLCHHLHT